jgi:MinD superfamily P-loop ATPase
MIMELAVISGKGGTGKSSLTAAFATAGDRIIVADCDVDAANLYLLFNPEHEKEIVYTGGHKAVVDHTLCTVCGICESYCRKKMERWFSQRQPVMGVFSARGYVP